MPAIANITVKKNDNTTDVIYTGVVPSAGDKSPAVWRNATVGSAAGHQPQLTMTSRSNGPNTARRVEVTFSYPELVTGGDGRVSISERTVFQLSGVVPLGMRTTDVNEAVSQFLNLCASTLVKDSFKAGFSPT